MTLTAILALYAIALLAQIGGREETRQEGGSVSSRERLSLLRALVPRYHFFDVIEERIWLGFRPRESGARFVELLPRKARRPWFLFENAEENLRLFEESSLPLLAATLESAIAEDRAHARKELERRLEGFVEGSLGSREFALLAGHGLDARVVVPLSPTERGAAR